VGKLIIFPENLGEIGITMNVIAPDFTVSGERIRVNWDKKSEQEKQNFLEDFSLGPPGKPEDRL